MILRQYVPAFFDTDEPVRVAVVNSPADFERVDWVQHWTAPNHGLPFSHWAQSNGMLLAVYGRGEYWWVVGRLSGTMPELPEWTGPPQPPRTQ